MTFSTKFCVAFLCSGLLLSAGAQDKALRERPPVPLSTSLQKHDFARLQAETDQWLRDYETKKISGDEFVERMAKLLPDDVFQVSPGSDTELWVEKYPQSYAANYLFGVVLGRTASHLSNAYAQGAASEKRALFEKYSRLAEEQLLKSATLYARPYPTYCRLIQVAKELWSPRKLDYFKRALEIDPQAYEAQAALLNALAPKWGGSIAEVNGAVVRSKAYLTDVDGMRKLEALEYEIMGEDAKRKDTVAAIEFYRRSYRASPAPVTLWRLVEAGQIARQKGYEDIAIDLYGQVLAIDPANSAARSMRAFIFANNKKDLASAQADYLILVKAGDIWSQIQLGEIYMDGKLVKPDYDLAATYFQMAAAQQNPTAIKKLRELENLKKAVANPAAAAIHAATDVKSAPWVPELEAHDFKKLQATTERWLRDYANKKISGDELVDRLQIFYPSGSFKARWQSDVEAWLEEYPKSYAATYVLGSMLSSTAARRRGGSAISETPVQQLAEYEKFTKLAEEQFLRSVALFRKPYPSYCALMNIANEAKYYRLAVKADPKAFRAHSIHLQTLAPKWGGSIAAVDTAIAKSTANGMSREDKRRLEALAYEIKGDDARMSGDADAAIALYRTSYFTAPGPTRLWRLFTAAGIAQKVGNTGRALELYGEIIKIDKANVRALVSRGNIYYKEQRNSEAALPDYIAAAHAGNAAAQNQVGTMYMNGWGADKDFDLAESYFRKAEAQGDDYAIDNLQRLALHRKTGTGKTSAIISSSTIAPSKAKED